MVLLSASLLSNVALWIVLIGMFLAISGIGFTGPNAMALAMAEQGERAGTASAVMGSMQFACGLLAGLMLNFLPQILLSLIFHLQQYLQLPRHH